MVKKKRKREKNKTILSEKKMEVRNVSEQWDTGRIHVIRVHNRIHSADKNTAVQQKFTNYPTQRKNQRDYPPESYIQTI